jgi:DNA-binding CsgD family transcriptional regulator
MTAAAERSFVCPVLLGRATQLDAIRRQLQLALQGQPGILLLAGEAGIGKSRLVAEATTAAETHGFWVVQGNCFEQDRALPYSAILELLRSISAVRPGALQEHMGPLCGELAKLAPELFLDIQPSAVVDPEQEKRRLFYALAQVFVRLAAGQPLMIVVEDLHWSDETTQQFLIYLARQIASMKECRLLVLLTYRAEETGEELAHFLADLERQRLASEITLTLLTRAEIDVMVRAILGLRRSARRDFIEALHERTEGNPFFVEEVLKASVTRAADLTGSEPLDRQPLRPTIPRTVQDAVRQRVASLSDGARSLLQLAAVAGQRFDLGLLQRLTNAKAEDLVDQIKESLAAQLIVEESAERFRFRHALTREAIYSSLLGLERREMHRRIAEELERRASPASESSDEQIGDLAFHFYEAQSWEKALFYGRRAGERAQELFTPSATVQLLTRAIEAAHRLNDSSEAELLRLRAVAHEVLGRFEDSLADLEAALSLAGASGDRHQEWEALLGLGMLWSARDYGVARRHYESALDLARTLGDQRLVAHSLNRVGNYHINIDEPEDGIPQHEEALAIFEDLGDSDGITETLDLLGVAWLIGGDLARSRGYYERALRRFEEQGDRQGCVSAMTIMAVLTSTYQTDTLTPAATFREAEAWLHRAHQMAVELDWRAGECFALWNLGACLGPQAGYDRALRPTEEAIAIAEEMDHKQWLGAALFILGAIQLDLLQLSQSRASLERGLEIARQSGSMLWTRAAAGYLSRCYLQEGDAARAAETLDSVLAVDAPARTLGQRIVHAARVSILTTRGESAEALRLLDRLDATIKSGVVVPRLAALRADALALAGEAENAELLYVQALEKAEEDGSLALVWPLHAALCALHEKNGDREQARQAFAAAVRAIDAVAANVPEGILRDSFREAALARLPAVRQPSARQVAKLEFAGLTEREREIAALIAAGRSNAVIAETLVISERTVETHVSHILGKLGFASRSQIAAWATQRGIAPRA